MKILFISSDSPEVSIGGVERHIKNLMDYCTNNPIEAIFLLPAFDKESTEKIGKVSVIKKNFLSLQYKVKKGGKKEIDKKELREKSEEFFTFIKKLLDEENIGIVVAENFHVELPIIYSIVLTALGFLKNIPAILSVHSFTKTENQKFIINNLPWHKAVCFSQSVLKDCKNEGIDGRKLYQQYIGVNDKEFNQNLDAGWLKNKFGLSPNSKVILHASRIISGRRDILKAKGILNLITSFSKVSLSDPGVNLVIAVAVPPKVFEAKFNEALRKLKKYIKLNKVGHKVFIGQFAINQMPLVYRGSDIFVLASEGETFGQVFIEAMACGTPVIGTRVGGVPEIIKNGYNGFLIEPNNSKALISKMRELLYNETTRKNFINNGLKVVKAKFSMKQQLAEYFKYLEKIHA